MLNHGLVNVQAIARAEAPGHGQGIVSSEARVHERNAEPTCAGNPADAAPSNGKPAPAPLTQAVSKSGSVDYEKIHEEGCSEGDETEGSWRVTIRSFGSNRVIGRWMVRRQDISTSMTRDWERDVSDSPAPECTGLATGSSEHSPLISRGHGGGWHKVPFDRPLGSSAWLALRAARGPDACREPMGRSLHGIDLAGSSARLDRRVVQPREKSTEDDDP